MVNRRDWLSAGALRPSLCCKANGFDHKTGDVMPLPLIPIALGVSALAGAVFGTSKGVSAKGNLDEAGRRRREADSELSKAQAVYMKSGSDAKAKIEVLGQARLDHQAGVMGRYLQVISRVNEIRVKDLVPVSAPMLREVDLTEISSSTSIAKDILSGGLASLGVGVGAYAGVSAAATSFGVASTGTAISTLSGAAASKAAMAYLGGGAISAGGLGATAGAAFLGIFGLGAVLGAGGMAAEKYSEKELTEATREASHKQVTAAEMRQAALVADAIRIRAVEILDVIERLVPKLNHVLDDADQAISVRELLAAQLSAKYQQDLATFSSRNFIVKAILKLFGKVPKAPPDVMDFNVFNENEKQCLQFAVTLGASLYQVLKIELVDEAGQLREDRDNVMQHASVLAAT